MRKSTTLLDKDGKSFARLSHPETGHCCADGYYPRRLTLGSYFLRTTDPDLLAYKSEREFKRLAASLPDMADLYYRISARRVHWKRLPPSKFLKSYSGAVYSKTHSEKIPKYSCMIGWRLTPQERELAMADCLTLATAQQGQRFCDWKSPQDKHPSCNLPLK
jgi:hypothetical protein